MALTPGTRLGPYEIVQAIGAGGMGEVYRAWDPKLSRLVAIKVLSAHLSADAAALARFEREAHAVASLSHPNILGIYDFGTESGVVFAVMELLEGETLRSRLDAARTAAGTSPQATGLPARVVIDYALRMAQGLAAAHAKGVVHRDLKPDNVFITRDGQLKILDFGLAQFPAAPVPADGATMLAGSGAHTQPGTILGTVGYMSPEQARAGQTDARSDLFSLGVTLFELLSGARPFERETAVETLAAILKADPPDLPPQTPPTLDRLIRRCLEKAPDDRFQSARDLAFAIEALSSASVSSTGLPAAVGLAPARRTARSWLMSAALLVTGLVAGSLIILAWTGRARPSAEPPSFQAVTFAKGTVRSARFTSDGGSLVYGAAWNGQPLRTFIARPDQSATTPLALPDAMLLAVSKQDELLVSVGHAYDGIWTGQGTLGRVPLMGNAVRELVRDARAADWSADSKSLAVVRRVDGRDRLEYPAGTRLYETAGYVSRVRVSRGGDAIAFLNHPVYGDNRGTVVLIRMPGEPVTLTDEWPSIEGLAWSPDGRDVWFSASREGEAHAVYAVSTDRRLRTVYRAPVSMVLHDTAPDGRVLLSTEQFRGEISAFDATAGEQRDLSLLDLSGGRDISPDGRFLLITQFGAGSGSNYAVYLQRTDGAPAVRLGEGDAAALSPDGAWAAALVKAPKPGLALLPTGPGDARLLSESGILFGTAAWLPDNTRLLACGTKGSGAARCYVVPIDGGSPIPATGEGIQIDRSRRPRVSPDGKRFYAVGADGRVSIYDLDDGGATPVSGILPHEVPVEWAADSRSLYVAAQTGVPRTVYRLDLVTGARVVWKEIRPADPAGVLSNLGLFITPDGRSHAQVFYRMMSQLFVATGLR